jgi:hypothetical protein
MNLLLLNPSRQSICATTNINVINQITEFEMQGGAYCTSPAKGIRSGCDFSNFHPQPQAKLLTNMVKVTERYWSLNGK